MNVTRRVALFLICLGCAAPAAPQAPERERQTGPSTARAEGARRKLEAAAQRRGGAVAVRRGRALNAEATEAFSRTVRLPRGGTFELQNIAGDVTVTGVGGTEARIDALKRVLANTEQNARTALATIRIEVAERPGNVEVRTIHPRMNSPLAMVDYTVTLPTGANVIVRSGSGRLRLQNVTGEVRAQSGSGDLVVAALKRVRALRSISGNIDVSDSEADEFNVNTVNGNIVVNNLKSRMLDLHSVMGRMQLHDVAAERAVLQSTAGDLEYGGRLMENGRYQFLTHGGNIRVIPSGIPGFDLDAMTVNGDVRSDFVLKLWQQPGQKPRPRVQKMLRGTVGDASAVLTASSFSGNIVIVKP